MADVNENVPSWNKKRWPKRASQTKENFTLKTAYCPQFTNWAFTEALHNQVSNQVSYQNFKSFIQKQNFYSLCEGGRLKNIRQLLVKVSALKRQKKFKH